jgi:hypothetical protein
MAGSIPALSQSLTNIGENMKEFGIFVYDTKKEDEGPVLCTYGLTREESIEIARQHELYQDEYIEVWEKDEDGLYGNSGQPLYTRFRGCL